jgi:hypothetical protein
MILGSAIRSFWVAPCSLMFLVCSGCIVHPTLTPTSGTSISLPSESWGDPNKILVAALYLEMCTLGIDTEPSPDIFRVHLLAPNNRGQYRVPIESTLGVSGFLWYVPFTSYQLSPTLYVWASDGTNGWHSAGTPPKKPCSEVTGQSLAIKDGNLQRPTHDTPTSQMIESGDFQLITLMALLLQCKQDIYRDDKFMNLEDMIQINKFVATNKSNFSDVTRLVTQRMASHFDNPGEYSTWNRLIGFLRNSRRAPTLKEFDEIVSERDRPLYGVSESDKQL